MVSRMTGCAAFALGALLLGCGGAEPAPQAPAAAPGPAPAPAAKPGDACNELLIGLSGLTRLVRESGKDVPATTAASLRNTRRSIDAFVDLRAQIKRAVAIDSAFTDDATALDQILAGEVATLDALAKQIESDATALRALLGEVEGLRALLAARGACAKKDAACAASSARIVATFDKGLGGGTQVAKLRQEVAAASFKKPELETARQNVLKKLDEMDRVFTESQKQGGALADAAEAKKGDLGKATEKVFARCGVTDDSDRADVAVRRPSWITAKEPDLRKSVAIVRVVPEGRIRARLEEWAQGSTGVKKEVFTGAMQGGFGSGFFVVPKEGEIYVVTSRHVVDVGDRATLAIGDGPPIAADIVYTDPKVDLAVLKPARDASGSDLEIRAGLGLELEPAKDQQVVLATGYPGIGARPSSQTTRGHVSNQHFVDPWDGAVYIQHTAAVDRGGSGGPLTSERNLVVGVNTLKIKGGENVTMAVPAAGVAEAVAHAQAPVDTESLQREARAACIDVVAELGAVMPHVSALLPRISLAMVAESGAASFNTVADRELSEMLLVAPLDALRATIVERLMHDAHAARLSPFESCASPEPDDWEHILTLDRVRFKTQVGAETRHLVVRRERGRFQLLRFDLAPEKTEKSGDKPAPAKKKKKPQAAQR